MPMMTVRKAETRDLDSLAALNQEAWHAAYRDIYPTDFVKSVTLEKVRKDWEFTLQDRNPSIAWFVAEDEHKVIGYAGAGRIPDAGLDYASELYSVIVAPSHHHKKVATKLISEVAQFLQGVGAESMMVWIPEANSFHRFYEQHGGERLENEMEIDYGGKKVKVIAYGWKSLNKLAQL